MYNPSRLEWHQGGDGYRKTLQITVRSCQTTNELLISVIRFVVALAKSQDRREICRVFSFGQRNAVRRWLRLRYPVTRASQSRERGRSLERGGLKKSGLVRCEDMAPKSTERTVDLDHGKAVLCSNIHQKAGV